MYHILLIEKSMKNLRLKSKKSTIFKDLRLEYTFSD